MDKYFKTLADYGVHHIGFVVKDINSALEHFNNLYGIKNYKLYDYSPNKAWSYGEVVSNYQLKIAMLNINNSDCLFEIIQPVNGKGVHEDFVKAGNNGYHHICFSVDDFDYWKDLYLNKGYDFIFEAETEDEIYGYRRCFYTFDKAVNMILEIKENAYFR